MADATVGSAYEDTVEVSYNGNGTLTYTAEGLPEGLSIDGSSGRITGTPAAGADTGSPYTVKVTVSDGKLTATKSLSLTVRQQGQFVITVTTNGGGMVLPVGGKITVMRGESQSFVIVADNGYAIADVLVDGKSVGAVTKYTFENVTEDHTLQVKFQKKYVSSGDSSSSGSSGSSAGVNSSRETLDFCL